MIILPPYQGVLSQRQLLTYVPPLDSVAGADYAYSLRKLRSAYTGPCMQIRGDGPGTWPKTIQFTGTGFVNQVQIESLAGSDTVWISRWYDQSGAGRDLTSDNGDAAGILVKDGVTQTRNGIMCPNFGLGKGASEPNQFASGILGRLDVSAVLTTGLTAIVAAEARTTDAYSNMFAIENFIEDENSGNSYNAAPIRHTGVVKVNNGTAFADTLITPTTQFGAAAGFKVWSTKINFGTKNVDLYLNGAGNGSGTATNAGHVGFSGLGVGGRVHQDTGDQFLYGKVYLPEIILFDAILSNSDRSSVEDNMMDFWGIT